ncbi:hypothetical protein H5410_062134 [Solanum commersonii]|uniref:non-specific serine/threonine protein kinase n=1 Tax=Solanum commersonii TaxID=4109 RepID=A0A9J5WBC6_SOLCO|nr:hypothetical protein H5410_062134 [Solanum commersonii]
MCPTQLFFISLLLLFIINSSRADNTATFGYCPSSVCDNGLNISYPFWRLDNYNSTSPQYCGYRGFGINCSQTDSIFYIFDDSFNVMKNDYNYSSLTLVDIDALDNSGCPRVHHNLTLNDDLPLEYSMLDLYLNFYYNCTHSPTSYFVHPLDCLNSSGNKSYYAEEEDFDWYRICEKKVVVPVTRPGSGDGLTRGVGAGMREGFLLHWVNATECVECEASDGRCGYNNSTQESLCFCKDGTIKFDYCNQGMRPTWPPPSRRGRGRANSRGGHILAQQGNRTLTSFNINDSATSSSGTSGIDINHPMYKEFMDFMKSKKELDNNPPSYSSILIDDENIEVFDMNDKKEVILLLEENDLKWRNEP